MKETYLIIRLDDDRDTSPLEQDYQSQAYPRPSFDQLVRGCQQCETTALVALG